MLQCKRCGTTWLARYSSADQIVDPGRARPELTIRTTGRPRFERVIEHEAPSASSRWAAPAEAAAELGEVDASPPDGRFRLGRMFGSWLGVVASVVVLALVAILALQLSAVDASPGGDRAQFSGIEIRLVRAALEPGRSGREVVVVGEITNRTETEIAVPGVRIAVLSGTRERRVWYHAPAEMRLAAGRATSFRSTLAAPPADVDAVAFRLIERRNMNTGTR